MKKLLLLMPALILAVSLIIPAVPAMAHDAADPQSQMVFADQTVRVGSVHVWNDADFLYVRFITCVPIWQYLKTDLHVATSLAGIPQTGSGNPKVGHFDYSDPHGLVLQHTYEIPLTWAVDTTLYIAAHAEVIYSSGDICREETAWAGGCGSSEFSGRNWATYFTYVVQ